MIPSPATLPADPHTLIMIHVYIIAGIVINFLSVLWSRKATKAQVIELHAVVNGGMKDAIQTARELGIAIGRKMEKDSHVS
jgi:hypothetical protein